MSRAVAGSVVLLGLLVPAFVTSPSFAGSHTWRVNEIFSNSDGTIQYIELRESNGACCEVNMAGKWLVSQATGNIFVFPTNLEGPTDHRYLLIATPAFAELPGAPTPDFLFTQVPFFATNGDTIDLHPLVNYDQHSFGPGVLPTDGSNAIHIIYWATDTFYTGLNTPTNLPGQSGFVNAGCVDNDGDGYGNPGLPECPNGPATDCDDSVVEINPGAVEACHDLVDNNCNDLTDCADPVCDTNQACVPSISDVGCVVFFGSILALGSVLLHRRRIR